MSDADKAEAARLAYADAYFKVAEMVERNAGWSELRALAYEMSSTMRDLNAMWTPAPRVRSANRESE
jgi:hypothetical protein